MQATALKPADHFGNDNVLYLMEDMATGEIRLSILWEWLHKAGLLTEDDAALGVKCGERFTRELFDRLLAEEYEKLLEAQDRDVRESSKNTTLPIAALIVQTYVTSGTKAPWATDLLNLNIDNVDPIEALLRLHAYYTALEAHATRITQNLDFGRGGRGQVL
jgi:malate synthase